MINPNSTTESLEQNSILDYLRGVIFDSPMSQMMKFQEDPEVLESLSLEDQKRIFLDFADRDAYETINFQFLYISKPYALEVLKRATLKDPENAISAIKRNPESAVYSELKEHLIGVYGEDTVEKEFRASGFTIINRIRVYGLLKGLFAINVMKPLNDVE